MNAIHKSKPPLRWIANLAGSIASKGILEISYMEDNGDTGFKYKYYGWLWSTFWPIYEKYGTVYLWNQDTDAYWERTGTVDPDYVQPWKFVDPWTGDAFRIIKGGK